MPFRAFAALFLSLVLQISLVGASSLTQDGPSCPENSSCCCEQASACPCADSGDEHHQPTPLLPVQQERPNPIPSPLDPEVTTFGIPPVPLTTNSLPDLSEILFIPGYRGVALPVAFCRFTI